MIFMPGNEMLFVPGKSHGERSLVGYSPWSCEELDMTENKHTHLCAGRYVCMHRHTHTHTHTHTSSNILLYSVGPQNSLEIEQKLQTLSWKNEQGTSPNDLQLLSKDLGVLYQSTVTGS